MSKTLILLYISTLITTGLIGFFVLLQDKVSASNRSFFGFTIFQALWILLLFFVYQTALSSPPDLVKSEFFVDLVYGAGLIMMLFLVIFLYYFPRRIIEFGRIKSWIYIAVVIVMGFLASFTELVHNTQLVGEGMYLGDTYGPLYGTYSILLLTTFLLATFIATKKTIVLKGLERRKMVYVMVGIWVFCITTITTNLVLPAYGIGTWGSLNLLQISPSYTLFFTVPTFYSIYKHRFFNLSNSALNLLRSFITFSAYFLSIAVIYFLLGAIFTNDVSRGILSALLAIMVFKLAEGGIPHLMTKSLIIFKNTITEIRGRIYFCRNYEELQKLIEGAFLLQLNFVSAKVYVVRKAKEKLSLPVYKEDNFTKALAIYGKDGLVRDEIIFKKIPQAIKKELTTKMDQLEADLCIPLCSEKNLIGFFVLKQNPDATTYDNEDLKELLRLKKDLEIGLMNILLKMNLQEENDLMKSIVNKKTKQLKKKIDVINELLKQQSDFIAVTAHEFRTPLSIAMFQLDEVMDSKRPKKDLLEDLQVIDQSLENLKLLTQKLFTVQQYDLNKVEVKKEKTSIRSFIKGIYSEFTLIMKDKDIDFTLNIDEESPMNVLIDRAQLRQALHNILNNAFKFASAGGKVNIEVLNTSKYITLRIEDSGDGIPDDLKSCIFEKFRTKSAGAGIGLGLYLCKKIMELHKGKVWVEDSPLGGACFCIQLKKAK